MQHGYVFIRDGGEPSGLQTLRETLEVVDRRVKQGQGPFTTTVDGVQVGNERTAVETEKAVERLLLLLTPGQTLRVRNEEQVIFAGRCGQPAFEVTDTSGNDKADLYWSLVKAEFPTVTFLGSLVCKPDSQHRYGNAVDVGFSSPKMGQEIWEFSIDNRLKYDLRNLIVQQKIWHMGSVSPYDGVPHVSHDHADFNPTFSYSLPCGLRG